MSPEILLLWVAGMIIMLGSFAGWNWLWRFALELEARRAAKWAESRECLDAIAKAKERLEEFKQRLGAPQKDDRDFMILADLNDEWVWLSEPRFEQDWVFGIAEDGPDWVGDMDLTQGEVRVEIVKIIDWRYKRGNTWVGDFLNRASK